MLVTMLGFFSKGLGGALQREISRRQMLSHERTTLPDLLRTFEILYWLLGIVLAFLVICFSQIISQYWLKSNYFSQDTLTACFILVGVRLAIAFPNAVYQSVFIGTQKQVAGNIINTILVIITAIITIFSVYIWKSVVIYFLADVINAVIFLIILRYWANKIIHNPNFAVKGRFIWAEIVKLWRLSFGLMWISGIGLIVTQLDQIMIVKLLPLASLGIYNVGSAGGKLLTNLSNPFLTSSYPQTCQIVTTKDNVYIADNLIKNIKIMLILTLSCGLPLSFYSNDILEIWTRNVVIANNAANVMAIYVLGNICIAVSGVLYQYQVAMGLSRYGVFFNTAALFWYPIIMWLGITYLDLSGAAWAWFSYCALSLLYNIIILFFILLEKYNIRFFLTIFLLTVVSSISMMLIFKYLSDMIFIKSTLGKLSIGIIGSFVILITNILINFGFKSFQEYKNIINSSS